MSTNLGVESRGGFAADLPAMANQPAWASSEARRRGVWGVQPHPAFFSPGGTIPRLKCSRGLPVWVERSLQPPHCLGDPPPPGFPVLPFGRLAVVRVPFGTATPPTALPPPSPHNTGLSPQAQAQALQAQQLLLWQHQQQALQLAQARPRWRPSTARFLMVTRGWGCLSGSGWVWPHPNQEKIFKNSS